MLESQLKILVLFVEPMLYGMDLIHEVYEQTPHRFQYIYCHSKLTGKDDLMLPENAFLCSGDDKSRKSQITNIFDFFKPDFVVINGYVGVEQVAAIRYCQRHKIPYAIESDTPLHIPENAFKALVKKILLRKRLHHVLCYGFPGGTLQKENLVHYGIPEKKNYIMPMSVSELRIINEKERIPNKNDLKIRYGICGKKTFLFVGRLVPEKNVALLVEAFAELKKTQPDTALLIIGDGVEMGNLKKKAENLLVSDVHFMGYVTFPEIVEFYKAADVFVLPSQYEPWGLVINEAMIMGLPVIVSDKVGCRKDLVIEGKNGYLFKNGSKNELLKVMSLMDNSKIKRFSKKAVERIRQWNYQMYLENFMGALDNVKRT